MELLLPGIYTITNIKTGRVYVGQTARTFKIRWENHLSALRLGKHKTIRLMRAWQRDGEAAFVFAAVEIVARPDGMIAADYRALLCEREQFWTDALEAFGPRGFNMVPSAGSSLGHRHSAEARANMSMGQQRRGPVTAKTRAKLGAISRGKPKPAAVRAAMSAAQKGIPRPYMAAMNTAREWSPEARQKVREMFAAFSGIRIGTEHTEETRAKMRAAWIIRRARQDRVKAGNAAIGDQTDRLGLSVPAAV